MRQFLNEYFGPFFDLLNYNLFALGDAKITPLSLVYLAIFAFLLVYLSRKMRDLLISNLLQRTNIDRGAQAAIGTIARYVILVVGFLIIIQSVGINLTTLNVLAGAVGVGVGFGLQNIANNFISGLIILFERPIKVGDRVEVDDIHGEVIAIGARSTSIKTNDNITMIVPNSKFISENVTNWSFGTDIIRFRVPVGVSYDSDVDQVADLLLEVASENPDVAKEPAPMARLNEMGDNSINFELLAWSRTKLHRPGRFKSELNFAIVRKFREHGIEIPFPQRDIHIRSGFQRLQENALNAGDTKVASG